MGLKLFNRILLSEIVAAFVLFGVLGDFLHERFTEREAHSRSIALAGLAGSVRSGAALAHSIWISDGAAAGSVALSDGDTIEIDLLTGYPRANHRGIHSIVPELAGFEVKADQAARTVVFSVVGVSPGECNVTYRTGAASGQPPTVTVTSNKNGGDCG